MKLLGLYQLAGQRNYRKVTDYTESQILEAFQKKCAKLCKPSESDINHYNNTQQLFSKFWALCRASELP